MTSSPELVTEKLSVPLGAVALFTRAGAPKLVAACSFPLTARGCVSRFYTDHATVELDPVAGAMVLETWGASVAELRARLGVDLGDGGESRS